MLTTPLLNIRLIRCAKQGHLYFGVDASFVNCGQLLTESSVLRVGFEEFVGFVNDEAFDVLQADAGFRFPLKEADETTRSRDQYVEPRPWIKINERERNNKKQM